MRPNVDTIDECDYINSPALINIFPDRIHSKKRIRRSDFSYKNTGSKYLTKLFKFQIAQLYSHLSEV